MRLIKSEFILYLLTFVLISFNSCNRPGNQEPSTKPAVSQSIEINIPAFNADSALAFVKAQTDFGARVPASKAHAECAVWLSDKLLEYTPHVTVQEFKARVYNGEIINGKNIIASFNPDKRARIMLCAHWDSRPFADYDPDVSKRDLPVMGANDGASGVGVILELARIIENNPPNIGVDIIFFDLEDYGPPKDAQQEAANEQWGLGSQYWSRNPHIPDYRARFVILLDMVGASGATFKQEGFSLYYAPDKVDKVWDIAASLGYQGYFLREKGGYINDDHYFINEIRKIPAIDIIHLDPNSTNGSFYDYWHTTGDTFDKIDKATLLVVGKVLTKVVYSER